jgi:hypothetical protein
LKHLQYDCASFLDLLRTLQELNITCFQYYLQRSARTTSPERPIYVQSRDCAQQGLAMYTEYIFDTQSDIFRRSLRYNFEHISPIGFTPEFGQQTSVAQTYTLSVPLHYSASHFTPDFSDFSVRYECSRYNDCPSSCEDLGRSPEQADEERHLDPCLQDLP